MPWIETDEQNRLLFEALTQLAAEKGALERLTGAINADKRALATDLARRGDKHQANKALLDPSTLDRWQKEGLARLTNAQPHKKRLVYEFLERSPDFRTDLYRPEGQLPPGFLAYIAEHGARMVQPFVKDLSKLDGAFELFRPAWTTPARRNRVLVSRLLFTTSRGFTRFREEQDYIDTGYHDMRVQETDEGAVLFVAGSIILFGFGVNAERVKLFVTESWYDSLDSPSPVMMLSGTMIGVSGGTHQRAYPFRAVRTKKPFSNIETGIVDPSDTRLTPQTLLALGIEIPA
ncbi:MAG: hypothetical protein GC199_02995 [Alphaproteobacteria bacterium]|nr:hypothetical protein [Alphaproteobacteria bacterium]